MCAEHAARMFGRAKALEQGHVPTGLSPEGRALEAQRAREAGEQFLKAPERLVGTEHTEMIPDRRDGETVNAERQVLLNTLSKPDVIAVDASEERVLLARQADILSPALDAAASAQATSSIEKMLAHQLAAAHALGMKLLGRVEQSLYDLPPVELARLTNAVTRAFEVYQSGCMALQKLKTRGTQRVIVQYQQVNVADGGQAMVAGRVARASRSGRRGRKNAR
jgi:hypothetical protein